MFESTLILVAEADDQLRTFLADQLSADGGRPLIAEFPEQALARAATHRPRAVVLGDLGAAGAAVDFGRTVRRSGGQRGEPSADLRILALTDTADELAVLRLYDAGVDDVVSRTTAYAVLRARLRVLLGLAGSQVCAPTLRLGPLDVSIATRQVWLRSESVNLSSTEFELLSLLASQPTRVFTRQELLRDVWGFGAGARTRTLDSHMCRLRLKLRAQGDQFIVSVWGVGYRLMDAVPREVGRAA